MLKETNELIGIDSETFEQMVRVAGQCKIEENRFNVNSEAGQRLIASYAVEQIGRNRLRTCHGSDVQGRRFVARWYGNCIEVIMESFKGANNFYLFDCDARMIA